jgi:hypothetical protein
MALFGSRSSSSDNASGGLHRLFSLALAILKMIFPSLHLPAQQ